ncbi:MAG: FAD-dependent 5-carboxymethylaminomethyl-2-thiouridine(34) oxidoreductase MnmC [Porticoccaceae bacterium]|nr:FAD-dependent 5-carboxymethylaminomethyl-2-thiouridine(34) oxidoreductase MnmC [Porticoccaceae bacterium]
MSDKNQVNSRTLCVVETAIIDWEDNSLRSKLFSDIYFSGTDSYKETQHVFIDANKLSQRWAQLDSDSTFTIIETGFGTGLNFLATAQLWLEQGPKHGVLQFTSIEKFPLKHDDLNKALTAWPELEALSAQLSSQYPPPLPGYHRLYFEDSNKHRRIALTLIYADATAALEQLRSSDHPALSQHRVFNVDAWFLDGFAPAKNPAMWTDELFQRMTDLSNPQTTFSTFTAAGMVRRGLVNTGFVVNKVPGYGSKREMLIGSYQGKASEDKNSLETTNDSSPRTTYKRRTKFSPPWYINASAGTSTATNTGTNFKKTSPIKHSTKYADKHAAIIGGGIAGCTTANALAQRGWQVTVYEKADTLAAGASGNPQGIIYPRLSPEASYLSRFNLSALLFAIRFYGQFWDKSTAAGTVATVTPSGSRCGVLVLPETPSELAVFARIANSFKSCEGFVHLVNNAEIEVLSGLPLQAKSSLYFPTLGWVEPRKVCEQLVKHPNIRVEQADINEISLDIDNDNWQLQTAKQARTYTANTVVIATSHHTRAFKVSEHLPLKAIRGQISSVPATDTSRALKTVICGAGYLSPASDDRHTFGATYNLDTTSEDVRIEDHQLNLETLNNTDASLTVVLDKPEASTLSGRASLRCTTPDYLPLIGPAPIFEEFVEDFAALRNDARANILHSGSYWPGLYLHCGLGSRGFTYAPLGAELLADIISKDTPCLPRDLQIALHPGRFTIRDLKRKRI